MLNISKNKITDRIDLNKFNALKFGSSSFQKPALLRIILVLFILLVSSMFAPWTQFVRTTGAVTALKPEQRPQTIQNTIAGKIEKWYVQEGEIVEVGDTILFLSEINTEYFDPC